LLIIEKHREQNQYTSVIQRQTVFSSVDCFYFF